MSVTFSRPAAAAAFALSLCLPLLTATDGSAQSSSFQKSSPQAQERSAPPAQQPEASPVAVQPQAPGQIRQQVVPEVNEANVHSGWSTEVEQNFDDQIEPEASPDVGAPAEAKIAPPSVDKAGAIQRVNDYFNSITHLQGTFVQVDANNERTRGRFYVQRPGRIRFDYVAPSALRIVADGNNLSIEDLDLKTVDTYPLEKTPFRMLLAKEVDLVRDARIVDVKQESGTLDLKLADRARDSNGEITLIFENGPSLKLKEWVIDDAQGLKTRIMLGNLTEGKELSADFFRPTPMTFPTLPN